VNVQVEDQLRSQAAEEDGGEAAEGSVGNQQQKRRHLRSAPSTLLDRLAVKCIQQASAGVSPEDAIGESAHRAVSGST